MHGLANQSSVHRGEPGGAVSQNRADPFRKRRRVFPLRRGYSLAALFLLIATIAVLAAMASSLPAWGEIPWDVATANLVVGALGGSLIGGTIGIHYERRLRSTALGVAIGATAGLVGGALSVSQFNPLMAFLQCGVLVTLAVLVRLTTPSRPKLKPLPEEVAMVSLLPRLARAHRLRLLAAMFTAGCTVVAILSLIIRFRSADLTASHTWLEAGAGLMLVLFTFGLTLYLGAAALRHPPDASQPTRSSPWD